MIKRIFKSRWSFESLNVNSGMHANEINAIESHNGVFYLATANGLHIINPEYLSQPNIQIPIYITRLQVNQQLQKITKKLEIPYSRNNIQN